MPRSSYEAHLTVRCADGAALDRLRRWSAARGLKLTHVVLARGRTPSQPMLTLRDASSYAAQLFRARAVGAELEADGFAVARVKIESDPLAPEVPRGPCDDGRHFEHHVKLRLDAAADLTALAARVAPHGAHLSWNARRVTGPGHHERFITQRCRGVDARGARQALDALLGVLSGEEVLDVEREFVLYDSDASVDAGWLDEELEELERLREREEGRAR
ncbi:hypothetical protein [Streptomyces fragilis]|uniref:Ankyrin n=1 Tax=Streptomyces fragilis TaxID=67301 RepID=A0ABV2YJ79_9ACTN|nr:hypothetical protein [Streptomyces fragilis]